MIGRREYISAFTSACVISLSGCTDTDRRQNQAFQSFSLKKYETNDYNEWMISVNIDEGSDAHYIEYTHESGRYGTERRNLPETQYNPEFQVVSYDDDSYSSHPAEGHEFALIDGDETIAKTKIGFKERISAAEPDFMQVGHYDKGLTGKWNKRGGGGHVGFTFSVTNTGEYPVQIASAVVEGDVALGPGDVSYYWPTAVWYQTDDGNYDFRSNSFDDDDVHHSLMLDPGESTRIGAMGYNISDDFSLCDGRTKNANFEIKTLNEHGVVGNFNYQLDGQKDAGGCTQGNIKDFETSGHY